MSTEAAYPYSVLCTLSAADGDALKKAAALRQTSVRALLREYVTAGLQGDRRHGFSNARHYPIPLTLAEPIAAALEIVGTRKDNGAIELVRNYVTTGIYRDLIEMGEIHVGELTKTWTDDDTDTKGPKK